MSGRARGIYLSVCAGKVRVLPKPPRPEWKVFPDLFYKLTVPIGEVPPIPDGWRPLYLSEKPGYWDKTLYWGMGPWVWDIANPSAYPERTVRRIGGELDAEIPF